MFNFKKLLYILILISSFILTNISLSRPEDDGGGNGNGGGSTTYTRSDQQCSVTCQGSRWVFDPFPHWEYYYYKNTGWETHCYTGGNELCTPQTCTASC